MRPKLRLCFVNDPASIHVKRWVRYFVERGHEIHIITSRSPTEVSLPGVTLHPFKSINIGRPGRVISRALFTRKLVRGIAPDILHVQYVSAGGWSGVLTGWRPLVISGWGSDIHTNPRRSRLANWLTRFALGRADLMMCQSAYLRDEMIRLGARADRTHPILLGVDTAIFRPGLDCSTWRTDLELSDRLVVFSPRLMRPIYNIDTIVQSIPIVLDQVPQATFVQLDYLPSDKSVDYKQRVQELIEKLGIRDSVRLIRGVAHREMPTLYNLADVVVSVPSADEFAVTYQEAMACGTPIIASDLPAYQGWIAHGHNGLIVKPHDAHGLAEATIKLLQGEELRQAFSLRNLKLARDKLDFYSWMQRVEDLYYELI